MFVAWEMSDVTPFSPPLFSLEVSFDDATDVYSMEKTTLQSLFEFVAPMTEVELVSIYQYALTITSLSQVAHPTSARVTGNKIQDQMARQMESVTLSVPLKVVQAVVDIIPTRVLKVFVADPIKFFGLSAITRVNYARMGGSGDFLAKVSKSYQDRSPMKAPKIDLTERWLTSDDLLEPLRLLVSIVLLSNVTYGLCLLGLMGVVTRRFSELRLTNKYEAEGREGSLLPLHTRQLYHYVEIIRRRYEWEILTVDQVPSFFTLQQDIYAEAIRLERSETGESPSVAPDPEKAKEVRSQDKLLVRQGFCDHFNGSQGCRNKDADCKYWHKCSECKSKGHGRSTCPAGKDKKAT